MTEVAKWAEASRCPRCGHPGTDTKTFPKPDKSVVHVLLCENKVCPWYNTTWLVQVMDDGTVPVQTAEEAAAHKVFPEVPSAKRQAEAILDQITEEEQEIG